MSVQEGDPVAAAARPRWMTALVGRRWVLPVVVVMPALVALTVGLWVRSRSDERVVHLYAPLWVTIATIGLLVTAAAGAAAVSWKTYRRYAGGYTQVVSSQVQQARRQSSAESWVQHITVLSRLDHKLEGLAAALRLSIAAWSDKAGTRSAQVGAAEQSERITRLATDLGTVLKAETAELALAPVPLVPLVERAVAQVRADPTLRGPEPVLDIGTPSSRLVVRGDPELLSAAVRHLVANAVGFCPPEASVTVRCVADEDVAVLEVADTGPGIALAEVDEVWEMLVQGSNATDRPGSGLGLPLVRTVVERHDGAVTMSSHLGEGTSVLVQLPLDPQPDGTTPPGLLPERAGDQEAPSQVGSTRSATTGGSPASDAMVETAFTSPGGPQT